MRKQLLFLLVFLHICPYIAISHAPQTIFTHKFGDTEVTFFSERQRSGNTDILLNVTPEVFEKALPDGTFTMWTNVYLVRTEGLNILIDAGLGDNQNLITLLESLKISPEDINAILITHLHPDHIGGIQHHSFPKAKVYLSQAEYDFWMRDVEVGTNTDEVDNRYAIARQMLAMLEGNFVLLSPEELGKNNTTIFHNIYAIATYGHTPGHTSYLVGPAGNQILIWGDMMHIQPIQTLFPELGSIYDVSVTEAISTRQHIMKYAADKNIAIGGMHLECPGMFFIKKKPDRRYQFIPIQ